MFRYLGTSLEDTIVSIFMQFVPGGSIYNLLTRFGAFDEEVFCNYTRQILEGVEYLHANNVIHRYITDAHAYYTMIFKPLFQPFKTNVVVPMIFLC